MAVILTDRYNVEWFYKWLCSTVQLPFMATYRKRPRPLLEQIFFCFQPLVSDRLTNNVWLSVTFNRILNTQVTIDSSSMYMRMISLAILGKIRSKPLAVSILKCKVRISFAVTKNWQCGFE